MKKPVLLLASFLTIVIILAVVQVIVSNSLSTRGAGVDSLEQELTFYKKKNALLKEKLLKISSLNYVASSAAKIGFVEEKSRIFVSSSLPIAVKP